MIETLIRVEISATTGLRFFANYSRIISPRIVATFLSERVITLVGSGFVKEIITTAFVRFRADDGLVVGKLVATFLSLRIISGTFKGKRGKTEKKE